MDQNQIKTVFVVVTDYNYFPKAEQTIKDLRSTGEYMGDIVVISVNFSLNNNFIDLYSIIEVKFPEINKTPMLEKIGEKFPDGDGREFDKINQWEKLHVFDDYFLKWDRVVFMDAGLRIVDTVSHLLDLDYKNCIIVADDNGTHHSTKVFKNQISYYDKELVTKLINDFGDDILEKSYFLNCMWIYDTDILKICNKEQLIEAMNKYPLCKNNEMTLMNLMFNFKYNLWKPLPECTPSGKFMFEWCELNHPGKTWKDFCYIKYPVTL